jgi:hypothetical protein
MIMMTKYDKDVYAPKTKKASLRASIFGVKKLTKMSRKAIDKVTFVFFAFL